jgi:predicted nucleic acid-binding protein
MPAFWRYPDALIIEETINSNLIKIKEIENKDKVDNLRLFGLHLGEAEAVALYFQEKECLNWFLWE